jgi:hypothetical protein
MEEVLNYGVMEVIIMESIEMDKNMVMECIIGLTDLNMQVLGNKMKCME